jgi:hypothetical protein
MDSDDPKIPYMQLYFYDSVKPDVQLNTVFTDANGNFSNSLSILGNMILTPTTYNNFRPRSGSVTFKNNSSDVKIGFRSASAPAPNLTGVLEGNIYNDTNRNRTRDNGESSIYFYKLYLQDNAGNYYNTVENAQTTDAGGHFKWVNLPADRTYTIRLSNDDYVIDQTEYSFTLSASNTQNTNIEIPIYQTN